MVINKKQCCGCRACVEVCPKKCISFEEDKEYFEYPAINQELCIDCGLCKKVCPIINNSFCKADDIKVFAGKYISEDVQFNSSSGGAFTAIYESCVKKQYSVCGVRWTNDFKVIHDIAVTEKEC